MNTLMAFEGTRLSESNTTVIAFVRFVVGVRTLVKCITAMDAKSFATFLTEVPIIVCVQNPVFMQILPVCERESAYIANVRFFAGVGVDVVLDMGAPPKNLFTQQTLVLHSDSHELWSSSTGVNSLQLFCGKLHATTSAYKRFRTTVLLAVLGLMSYKSRLR
jgi:hypothetical protein